MSPALHYSAVAPLALPGIGAMGVLLLEVFLAGRTTALGRPVTRTWLGTVLALVASAFLVLALLAALQVFVSGESVVFNPENPLIRLDRYSSFAVGVLAAASLLACLLSISHLAEQRIDHGEYYALLLLATSGMMVLVAATDLITLFLGLEIASIPLYVLAGFARRDPRSNESALKYFLTGSTASALMLYGMALLYGATGHTDLEGIRAGADGGFLVQAGIGLLLVGFTFKISSVPFHQWTPDVYQGAPTSVTAYMSVTVKLAAFVALIRVLDAGTGGVDLAVGEVLRLIAISTMVVGNAMAVIQDDVKRLLAYSSIAHAGTLLIGVLAATDAAHAAVLFYLLGYALTNLGAFAVVIAVSRRGAPAERIDDFAGLARRRPALALAMTLFMLSLAGIPGTVGFIAKFGLFVAAVGAGEITVTVVAVLTSVVSVYYYLRIPVAMYMREPGAPDAGTARIASGEWTVIALCAALVLWLGFFPADAPLSSLSWIRPLDWARDAAAALH